MSKVVKNNVVKKTDYNTLKSKVDGIDVSKYVGKSKYETDGKAIYDKIDAVEKKIPVLADFVTTVRFNHEKKLLPTKTALTTVENKISDISNLATKTSLSSLLPVCTFNSKVTELEGKVTTIDNKFSEYAKKTDVASDITQIKNDYATNSSLDSKLNDLKAQHIATEVKTIDDKTKKNAGDISGFENKLKQKEIIVDENQRELSFFREFFSYTQNSNLVYECKVNSMKFDISGILEWKPKDIYDSLNKNVLNSVRNTKTVPPNIKKNINGQLYVSFNGNFFKQDPITIPNNAINIYVVYKLDPIFKMLYLVL